MTLEEVEELVKEAFPGVLFQSEESSGSICTDVYLRVGKSMRITFDADSGFLRFDEGRVFLNAKGEILADKEFLIKILRHREILGV